MKAIILNCTLKLAPEKSNTEALAKEVIAELEANDVDTELIRVLDYTVRPGITNNEGDGDDWPQLHQKILAADMVIIATPTWLGQPASVSKRVLERMNAMMTETRDNGLPVAFNKVAGVIVTGNEDGAHHVISEIAGALIDLGFTVPGQAWTYWNKGPGPGPSYLETDEGHEWSANTGRRAARLLVAVADALQKSPIPSSAYGK